MNNPLGHPLGCYGEFCLVKIKRNASYGKWEPHIFHYLVTIEMATQLESIYEDWAFELVEILEITPRNELTMIRKLTERCYQLEDWRNRK